MVFCLNKIEKVLALKYHLFSSGNCLAEAYATSVLMIIQPGLISIEIELKPECL